MSESPINSLDQLLAMSTQAGGINPPAVSMEAPQPPSATPPSASPVVPPSATQAPPAAAATPAGEKPSRKPRAKKTDVAPAAPVDPGIPDPPITFQPNHVSSMGGQQPGMTVADASTPIVQATAPVTAPAATPVANDLLAAANGAVAGPPATHVAMVDHDGEPSPALDDDDGSVIDADLASEFDAAPVSDTPPPTMAATWTQTTTVAVSTPAPAAPASPPVQVQATTPPPAPQATGNIPDTADEIQSLHLQRQAVARHRQDLDQLTGIQALHSRDQWDRTSVVQEAMHMMKWEPNQLSVVSPQRLTEYEAALAANQAYVLSLENRWRADYQLLQHEVDRIIFIRREKYAAPSKTGSENLLRANDVEVRKLCNDLAIASANSTYLNGMGDSLTVVANGIKRAISLRIAEFQQAGRQGR